MNRRIGDDDLSPPRCEMASMDEYARIDAACRLISTGRRLARELSTALQPHRFSEVEFRLLWLLEDVTNDAEPGNRDLDQTALRRQLGVSAAQISTLVEQLRTRGLITPMTAPNDRRRRLWRLTPAGRQEFADAAIAVGSHLADGQPIVWDPSRRFDAQGNAA